MTTSSPRQRTDPTGQQGPQPPNDTSVLLGRLDLKLFAGAETDNTKAATAAGVRHGRVLHAVPGHAGQPGGRGARRAAACRALVSSYEVKFTDTNKPTGQIWAGVVGKDADGGPGQPLAPRGQRNERWFVVWLGTATNPVDKAEAVTLANSIRPWTPPPPPEPDPNAPQRRRSQCGPRGSERTGRAGGCTGRPPVGVGVPVDPANAPGMMPAG